jgi:hypothetical protein
MSKNLIRIIPHDEWVEKQRDLTIRQAEWEKARDKWMEFQGHLQDHHREIGMIPRQVNLVVGYKLRALVITTKLDLVLILSTASLID